MPSVGWRRSQAHGPGPSLVLRAAVCVSSPVRGQQSDPPAPVSGRKGGPGTDLCCSRRGLPSANSRGWLVSRFCTPSLGSLGPAGPSGLPRVHGTSREGQGAQWEVTVPISRSLPAAQPHPILRQKDVSPGKCLDTGLPGSHTAPWGVGVRPGPAAPSAGPSASYPGTQPITALRATSCPPLRASGTLSDTYLVSSPFLRDGLDPRTQMGKRVCPTSQSRTVTGLPQAHRDFRALLVQGKSVPTLHIAECPVCTCAHGSPVCACMRVCECIHLCVCSCVCVCTCVCA